MCSKNLVRLAPIVAMMIQSATTAHSASSFMEATGVVNNGCSFGAVEQGFLGQGPNMSSLSTEIAGGSRPSVVLHIVGNATLASSGSPVWTRDGGSLSGITTTSKVFNGSQVSAGEHVLPKVFTSPNMPVPVYWSITGQSTTAFTQAGAYKVSTTFTCY